MRLIQFIDRNSVTKTGIVENNKVNTLQKVSSTYELFLYAEENNIPVEEAATRLASNKYDDYDALTAQGRVLVPLSHPDPYRLWVTGTGLTHLGSAVSRNKCTKPYNPGRL